MPSTENRVVFACAGSGKTTRLAAEAVAAKGRRIAIITYTNNNTREILKRFGDLNSGVPPHVDVMTWFAFLLRECARPYQKSMYAEKRIESLLFVNEHSARYIPEENIKGHYFAHGDAIYSDKISKLVLECQSRSDQRVTSRLAEIYTDIFIDEFQDLAGWDMEVIRMFLESDIRVTLVGDPRQHIYKTNPSAKNKQYLGIGAVRLVEKWIGARLCTCEPMTGTYRCNQQICDFVNALWPGMEAMVPLTSVVTGHDGVFLVSETAVPQYIQQFRPTVLRHNKKSQSFGCDALNFGMSKGLQFDRVLIVPTEPIAKYLQCGELKHLEKSKGKLHVAVTRARHSVAFVFNGKSTLSSVTMYS